jgi:nitrate/TMAO reductase-like tetraheme cytochrome c subunit
MGRVSLVAIWGKKKNTWTEPESREERKKAGPIRRLWQKFRNIDWKNPVNRWKLLFASLVGCIVVFGGGYGVLSFTNSPSFCSSCHEMQPEYTTYTASAHDQISCVQCHIKPGTLNMLTHKMKSLKEVYYHVTGVPTQIVQTEEEAVSNQNCLQCHSLNRDVTPSGDLKVNHKKHIEDGIPCITCHSGVVHAKIAARDLNVALDRSDWTKQTVDKLVEEKYLRPNMGTCIDCHNKVNKGEKPWKDPTYLVPPNPEETASKAEGKAKTDSTETTDLKDKKATQEVILESLKAPTTKNLKVSMACSTCHSKISLPKDHQAIDWNQDHGTAAVKELDKCFTCHQDSKWTKAIPKQDIVTLLKLPPKGQKYVPNLTTAKEEARSSNFCNTCHAQRPSGHLTSDQWLTGHASHAQTNEQKAECYVCHDRNKPIGDQQTGKAPTDVYCQNCHRTGFKGESKN